jgi:hypothetical protein
MSTKIERYAEKALVEKALATILVAWPLYREFIYEDLSITRLLPELLEMYCDHSLCRKETIWETSIYGATEHFGWYKEVVYSCRNCGRTRAVYHFHWYLVQAEPSQMHIVKFGQWPALEKRISSELKRHLGGEGYELYQKALRCRSQNLGIGALSYMRRLVEDRTNELLDMLGAEATQSGETVDLAEIEKAKKSFKFSDKIELATKIIPSTLRPGNHNPMDQLHDIASEGVHWKTEEECAVMFDKARGVFEFLFQEMERRKRAAQEFQKGLTDIATRNS